MRHRRRSHSRPARRSRRQPLPTRRRHRHHRPRRQPARRKPQAAHASRPRLTHLPPPLCRAPPLLFRPAPCSCHRPPSSLCGAHLSGHTPATSPEVLLRQSAARIAGAIRQAASSCSAIEGVPPRPPRTHPPARSVQWNRAGHSIAHLRSSRSLPRDQPARACCRQQRHPASRAAPVVISWIQCTTDMVAIQVNFAPAAELTQFLSVSIDVFTPSYMACGLSGLNCGEFGLQCGNWIALTSLHSHQPWTANYDRS